MKGFGGLVPGVGSGAECHGARRGANRATTAHDIAEVNGIFEPEELFLPLSNPCAKVWNGADSLGGSELGLLLGSCEGLSEIRKELGSICR